MQPQKNAGKGHHSDGQSRSQGGQQNQRSRHLAATKKRNKENQKEGEGDTPNNSGERGSPPKPGGQPQARALTGRQQARTKSTKKEGEGEVAKCKVKMGKGQVFVAGWG